MREGSWSSLSVCMGSVTLLKLWISSREIRRAPCGQHLPVHFGPGSLHICNLQSHPQQGIRRVCFHDALPFWVNIPFLSPVTLSPRQLKLEVYTVFLQRGVNQTGRRKPQDFSGSLMKSMVRLKLNLRIPHCLACFTGTGKINLFPHFA